MPQISIITPVFIDSVDKITWLDEMLQSVLRQTFVDWEVILIDDCSPIIFDEIKFKYQDELRFRWLKASVNQGPSMVRNSAVTLAESDTLLPIDSDDILLNLNVMQNMYDAYLSYNKEKVIYGNLQFLTIENNNWQASKVHVFSQYTFDGIMNLQGQIPVTAMHSVDCHNSTGGWKETLQSGLEDVEYWIAAGKAGFCGYKLDITTLLYRKHKTSRAHLLNQSGLDTKMRDQIMEIHSDVFNGVFPVGCCGKGNLVVPNVAIMNKNFPITTLDSLSVGEKIWVEYVGPQRGNRSIIGNSKLRLDYRILGTGHKFEIAREDKWFFAAQERGQGYSLGIPNPTLDKVEEIEIEEIPKYNGGTPELAILERLDSVAAQSRGIEPIISNQPVLIETSLPIFEKQSETIIASSGLSSITYDLSPLNLPENLQDILQSENWTVQKLAEANTRDLVPYPGIGPVKSAQIIESAKKWLGQIT